jgi:hypothetical protein
MHKLLIAALAVSLLAGCAGTSWDTTAGGTPITAEGLNQVLTQTAAYTNGPLQESTQAMLAQSANYQAPEVQKIKQPDGTTWVYCRGVTNALYVCRTY